MASRKLEVEIVGDASSLERALGKAQGNTNRFGKAFRAMGVAAAAGGAAAVGGIGFAIKASSDLGEQINKTSVVFGRNKAQVHLWSKDLTKNFGLSQRAALEAAGTYGNMLKPMGVAPALVSKMSMKMTELAGDMASFNNASPVETLDALRAGLAGETEPLRRFGIFLNDARLKQEALSMGLYDGTGALDAVAKAQATYSLILKDSKDAQGDFARTSESMPNLMRTFKGELENAAASLGQVFLPLATELLSWAASAVPKIAELVEALTDKLKPGFEAVSGTIPGLITHLQSLRDWVSDHVIPIVVSLRDIWVTAVQRIRTVLVENEPALKRVFERVGAAMDNLSKVIIPLLKLAFTVVLPVAIEVTVKALDKVSAAMESISSKKGPSMLDVMERIGLRSDWIKDKLEQGMHKGLLAIINDDKGLLEMLGIWQKIADWINRAWGHLKDFKKTLGDITGPSGLSLLKKVTGDASNPFMTLPAAGGSFSGSLHGASPAMAPFAALGRAHGLRITSGRTDHSKYTSSGNISDHWYGKALDLADGPAAMASFFTALIGNRRVKQAFYDPLGSIFGGVRSSYREGGHSDHVHVATYDKGGWLMPGLTLAQNNTGRPERIIGPGSDRPMQVNLNVDGKTLASILIDPLRAEAKLVENRTGRPAFA